MDTAQAYDSCADTVEHIEEVRKPLAAVVEGLTARAAIHDASKLEDPEKAIFDRFTPKLRDTTYGSKEYEKYLAAMGEGLNHHYRHNRHHPEFFKHGIRGMNLLDVIEMLCDWMAATKRHADGDIFRSIGHNRVRFQINDQLVQILHNTAEFLKTDRESCFEEVRQ